MWAVSQGQDRIASYVQEQVLLFSKDWAKLILKDATWNHGQGHGCSRHGPRNWATVSQGQAESAALQTLPG